MPAEVITFPGAANINTLEEALNAARKSILELEHENFDLRNLCADLALENRSLGVSKRSDAASLGRCESATTPM